MNPRVEPQPLVPERTRAADATVPADATDADHVPRPHSDRMLDVRRAALVAASVATVGMGLAMNLRGGGGLADPIDHALYAVLIYLLAALIRPRSRPGVVAAVAMGFCVAVELFQLTGIPIALTDITPMSRLVLGTTFSAGDLIVSALAIAAVAAIDAAVRRHLD